MKPEFQIKLLQHLNSRKQTEEGFTLIELLVVIIIIGILAAIALPSLLGQANKARQSEARNNIGSINRAQQGYYLEKQSFATDLIQLGAGVQSQTENYSYSLAGTLAPGGAAPDGPYLAMAASATPRGENLKGYVGLAMTISQGSGTTGGESLTSAVACETLKPTGANPTPQAAPTAGGDANLDCTKLAKMGTSTGWEELGG